MIASFVALTAMASGAQGLQGQALLDDLSRRAVRYFWEQSEPTTGLTRDRGPNVPGGTPNNPNISSIAATGYALASNAIGAHRGWLDRRQALQRSITTVTTVLNKVQGNKGWYYHFYDWRTGVRQWNSEVSSIDSAIFFAGMLIAERGFKDPKFSALTKQVMSRVDWSWMLTDGGARPNSLSFCHGWKPETGFLPHRWASFCEHVFLYVLAYGFYPAMPQGSWAAWARPLVQYRGVDLLVGGPLFMHQMSQGFFDFRDTRDPLGYDYFVESTNATIANRKYCIDNPQNFAGYGWNIWGLSACDIPGGYGAQGAPGWISDNGTLAPAAAVASVMFTPEASIRAGEQFLRDYPESYGQYGFTTGINPTQAWRSPDVIGIDLGQLLLCIENARDGLPNRWMHERPETARAFKRIGIRKTVEQGVRPLRIP
ncbi:MAG TPA: glucoamylase family protein [Fimbriimonadaceae bacterium]|nr:glucoamylase family protein [Fimbriimonadaceae bacterium]